MKLVFLMLALLVATAMATPTFYERETGTGGESEDSGESDGGQSNSGGKSNSDEEGDGKRSEGGDDGQGDDNGEGDDDDDDDSGTGASSSSTGSEEERELEEAEVEGRATLTTKKRFGNRCFAISKKPYSWGAAAFICVANGGRLANLAYTPWVIRRKLWAAVGSNPWVSANDLLKEGRWVWGLFAPVGRAWARGEPNNHSGNEHCATMYKSGHLNDDGCWKRMRFACDIHC